MTDNLPDGLRHLWELSERAARQPRLGLSLERIVHAAIELADADGLQAVSMNHVAKRLGFTPMSLYRHVTNKDELLLLMHDTAWGLPPEFETPGEGWRAAIERWCHAHYAVLQRHPWLEGIRTGERAGTPSQLAWMDRGLQTLADTPLTEYEKTEILLLLNGYMFWETRFALDLAYAARKQGFAVDDAAAAFGELLTGIIDPDRFPALRRAADAGIFATGWQRQFADFTFGLDRILDGVEHLVNQRATSGGAS